MRTLSPPWRRVLLGNWVVILVLSVAVVTLYVDNKRTRDCIADYMVADQEAAAVRFDVAEHERQQLKGTLRTTVTDPDRSARVKAIEDYIALMDRNDEVRKSNPIRQVPTKCR